jgi:hypothetical protein
MFCHFFLDGLSGNLHYWYCKKKRVMEAFREGGGRNHFVSRPITTIKVPATRLMWDGLGGN